MRRARPAGETPRTPATTALLLCALLIFSPGALRAQSEIPPALLELASDRVLVRYHPGDIAYARQTAATMERSSREIVRALGITFREPVTVFLARGRAEFNRIIGQDMPDWALAVALPGRQAAVVDLALVTPATANDMQLTLFHEIVHLALAHVERPGDGLPRWFHEGVATWLSGTRHLRVDRAAFHLAAAQGALMPFDRLAEGFPASPAQADLAYLQSEAFVLHLVTTRSAESIRWILDRYRAGASFEEAFRGALGVSRAEVEAHWKRSMRGGLRWVRALLSSITFWGMMAFATILAFLLIRRRNRRIREAWEREEHEWRVVGDEEEEEPDDVGGDEEDYEDDDEW